MPEKSNIIKHRSYQIFISMLCLPLLFSSCASGFDYNAYDYEKNNIELGLAFPAVQNADQLNDSISHSGTLNISNVRIGEHWDLRELSDDNFNWQPLENRLNSFAAAGIDVLLSLESHSWPAWLNSTGAHNEAATLNQFRNYVSSLLALYGNKIKFIQFGNEWNWEIDTYFAGNESAFIAYTNILNDEVSQYRTDNPASQIKHALGSFAGGNQLAYDQNLLHNITIGGVNYYQTEIAQYAALPPAGRITTRTENILGNCFFEILDIHLYDNVDDWNLCIQAYNQSLADVGKSALPMIVSEFGGPYAIDLYDQLGRPSANLLAERLISYIHKLDTLPVETAYFFKLNEDPGEVFHDDSFLINTTGKKMPAFEVLRRFGE